MDLFLESVERRAYHMAQFATRDREESLDIVQDSMLRFVRHYCTRPSAEWRPLFYRVLQNRILDWHRQRKTRGHWWGRLLPVTDDTDEEPLQKVAAAVSDDPLHALQRAQAMTRLESALQALPLRQQQVFLLRVWEGLGVTATARVLGVGEGSVKTHLSRALARLRAELGEVWS